MKSIRTFFVSSLFTMLGLFEAEAQDRAKVKVDPGVSVHNYKHPNKAAQARQMQPPKARRYGSKVGIVPRSTHQTAPTVPHETPKYARRRGWIFFKKSNPHTTKLNPLINPNHYKLNGAH